MVTGLVWDERYAWHDAGQVPFAGDFEPQPSYDSPATKRRLYSLIEASGLGAGLARLSPRLADDHELLRVHGAAHLARVSQVSAAGGGSVGESAWLGAGGEEEPQQLELTGARRGVHGPLAGLVRGVQRRPRLSAVSQPILPACWVGQVRRPRVAGGHLDQRRHAGPPLRRLPEAGQGEVQRGLAAGTDRGGVGARLGGAGAGRGCVGDGSGRGSATGFNDRAMAVNLASRRSVSFVNLTNSSYSCLIAEYRATAARRKSSCPTIAGKAAVLCSCL